MMKALVGLLSITVAASVVTVMLNDDPLLVDYLQFLVAGLIGLVGTVTGFYFGRRA